METYHSCFEEGNCERRGVAVGAFGLPGVVVRRCDEPG